MAALQVPQIVQTVGARIGQDSQRISEVAEHLVGIQSDINKVEHEALGKVFDMESMKRFMEEHKVAVAENQRLQEEITRVTGQIGTLAAQLGQMQMQGNAQESPHQAQSVAAQTEIQQSEQKMQQMKASVAEEKRVAALNDGLQKANILLSSQNIKASEAARQAAAELAAAKAKLGNMRESTKKIEQEIVQQHEYAEKCRGRVLDLEKQMAQAESKIAEERAIIQTAQALDSEALSTKQKNLTALLQSNAVLKARLRKAQANTRIITAQIVAIKTRKEALQAEGTTEVAQIRHKLVDVAKKADVDEGELMAKEQDRQVLEKTIRQARAAMQDVNAKKMSVEERLAALRLNNTRLRADMLQVHKQIQTSKLSMTKAERQVAEAKETVVSMRRTAEHRTMKAQKVASASLAQVAQAKLEDDEALRLAQNAVMEAQAQQLTDCEAIWDKNNPKILAELKSCEPVAMDLQTATAQVAALSSTVQASQA